MPLIFSLLIALAWAIPATAGSITFNFELQGDQCVVANRGDSTVYYPVIFQLGRSGQWIELKSATPPTELKPGGVISVQLGEERSAPASHDPDYTRAMLIRFFDQAGVSFGQIDLLRPPPQSRYNIKTTYAGNRLRIAAPPERSGILATWVLAPREEGIAPISNAQTFTQHQPPPTRIAWLQQQAAVVEIGAAMPVITLLHETADGFTLQNIQKRGAKKVEQRTAWLNMKWLFYATALLCGMLLLYSRSADSAD